MTSKLRTSAQACRKSLASPGIALTICCALLFPGCSAAQSSAVSTNSHTSSATSSSSASYDSFKAVSADFSEDSLDLEYSKRDSDASYDASSTTAITLSDATTEVDGAGASASDDGSTVTITAAGTYLVTGSADDGQIVVAAGEDDKVQLVLTGATIGNADGPAIYVQTADKCFITLADGTVNSISDGSTYSLEDGSDEPYATIYSTCDLTLNGTGTLNVAASYRHAICSKDDLVITDGVYNISAVEDGLRGRDSVKISGGTFVIEAGGDGIKSNRDDKPTKGFVTIDGGTFDIQAGDDGVQAKTLVRVAGGTLNVTANDDAFHSDLEMHLLGSTISVTSGDDAFHAETKLTVDDGTVDVTSCYEGYEAEKIYVNGGETHIVASDDGVNASAADLTDDSDTDTVSSTLPDGQAPGADMPNDAGRQGGKGGSPGGNGESDGGPSANEDGPTAGDNANGSADAGQSTDANDTGSQSTTSTGSNTVPEPPTGSEAQTNGGAPDNAFAEGQGAGGNGAGNTMGDENCLIQINGGYLYVDASGDGIDSNGNVEVTGGVLLVNGTASGGDSAFDYDLNATVSGGTVLAIGSTEMAQNFTSGTQSFAMTEDASGIAGQTVAVTDSSGNVVASLTAARTFGMVLVSTPAFTEGGEYNLIIGGEVSNANADGYTASGTISGGSSTTFTASTTATTGMGGLGSGGNAMPAGQPGDTRITER